jgi:DHA2 family methylenomycin A resistance protein-like MFS transporter
VTSHPRQIDVRGQAAATATIAGVVFTLIEGPRSGWVGLPVLVTMLGAIASAALFVRNERRAAEPVVPPSLLRHAEFTSAMALGALFNLAFYGTMFALTLLLQEGRGESPLVAGLSFLPLTGLIAVGSLVARRIVSPRWKNLGRYAGQSLLGLGLLGAIAAGRQNSVWPLLAALVPAGLGSGIIVSTTTNRVIGAAPVELRGVATGAFNVSRQFGGAIGVAVFGALLGTGGSVATGSASASSWRWALSP